MYRTPSPPPSFLTMSDEALPKPVTQPPARKNARFDTGLRVHWARFKSHLNTGSALSESVLDASGAESTEASSSYRRYVEKTGRSTPGQAPVDEGPVDEVVVDNQVSRFNF